MADVLLLHGFKCSSQSYFFPHLKGYLEKAGHSVFAPDFPAPETPDIDAWTAIVDGLPVHRFDLVVGHSLGGCLAYSMLTRGRLAAGTLAVIGASPGPKENVHMNTFLKYPLDFAAINKRVGKTLVIHSLDDPWTYPEYALVSLRETKGLALLYADKGHFETPSLPEDVLAAFDAALAARTTP